MVVEDLDDVGLLDPWDALGLLGVVDQEDAAALGAHEVRARHDADRGAVGIDREHGTELDHAIGDVGDELLRIRDGRVAAHDRSARHGQPGQTTGHVGVEWRGDDGGAVGVGELHDLRGGAGVVGEDQHGEVELEHPALHVRAVADHRDVARLEGEAIESVELHRQDPQPPRHLAVLPRQQLTAQDVGDRLGVHGTIGERRGPARVPDVLASQLPLGQHPGQGALVVDDGNEVDLLLGHAQPDGPHRLVAARGRRERPHDVAHAQVDVRQQLGLGCPAALERPRRLGVEVAQAHRDVLRALVEPALELGVADRRPDRVEVGLRCPVT
jgi:hypothetical protein